jgi:hypothetical protein
VNTLSAPLRLTLAAAALLALWPRASSAQDWTSGMSGATWNNPGSAYLDDMFSLRFQQRVMERRIRARSGKSAATPAASRTAAARSGPAPDGTTTFRPGRRAFIDQFPQAKRPQMTKLLADCDKVYGQTMAQAGGFNTPGALNDLASSAAFYVAIAHYVYWSDQPGAPAPAQGPHMLKLQQMLRERMLALGTLTNQNDVQKQTAHDGLVFSACLPMIRYSIAKKSADEPTKVAMRKRAGELLTKTGLRPNALHFNPDGTVRIDGIE